MPVLSNDDLRIALGILIFSESCEHRHTYILFVRVINLRVQWHSGC